jgi:hypothetical protein
MQWNFKLRHVILENALRYVGLEYPHRAVLAVDGRRALALVAVFRTFLPGPGLWFLIFLPDAVVEIA